MPHPPSRSPLMAKAKEIAKAASEDYLHNGTDPSEAIAKFAEDMFSDPFIELCANSTNHAIFQNVFSNRGKRTEYPVATADRVK